MAEAKDKKTIARKKRYVERPNIRANLLDAAEALIREEGYGAATARNIAKRVGMKHQAIFYYFGSQDELLVEVFRRTAAQNRVKLEAALKSQNPLRGLWDVLRDPEITRLTLEFMALANHNEMIRAEIAKTSEEVRELETKAIEAHLKARGIDAQLSPKVVSILTNAAARLIVQESTLGILSGHEEFIALSEASFDRFESGGETTTYANTIVDAMQSLTDSKLRAR